MRCPCRIATFAAQLTLLSVLTGGTLWLLAEISSQAFAHSSTTRAEARPPLAGSHDEGIAVNNEEERPKDIRSAVTNAEDGGGAAARSATSTAVPWLTAAVAAPSVPQQAAKAAGSGRYSALFRHAQPNMNVNELLGARPTNDAAVCELMLLGHPLCDDFLTGETAVTHADGAMVECVLRYGVAAWGRMLQPQCTQGKFWTTQVATRRDDDAASLRYRRELPDADALMDPIMAQHVGRAVFAYRPPAERTYATYAPPLVCLPPPLSDEERAAVRALPDADLREALLNATLISFGHEEFQPPSPSDTPRRLSPMTIRASAIGYAAGGLVRSPYREKLFDWYPVLPTYYPYFMPRLFRRYPARPRYTASARDEYILTVVMRLSYFHFTHARGGPECTRHYEILAAGAVPFFPDIRLYPSWMISGLPKELLWNATQLPGVAHMGTVEPLLSPGDEAVYKQTVMPAGVRAEWQRDRMTLLERLSQWRRSRAPDAKHSQRPPPAVRADDSDTLMVESAAASAVGADESSWVADQELEELYSEGQFPPPTPRYIPQYDFKPVRSEYYFRVATVPVFNLLAVPSLDWEKFDRERYFALADALHKHTKEHLSVSAIAATFLRSLGVEEPKHVLFLGPTESCTVAYSVWRGLLELGIRVTSAPRPLQSTKRLTDGPVQYLDEVVRESKLMRPFDADGMRPEERTGVGYDVWRWRARLDEMYGKNFFLGRRVPRTALISEKEAAEGIAKHAYDVVVLGYHHRNEPFGSDALAPYVRKLRAERPDIPVAVLDGGDNLNLHAAWTYAKENITIFSREPMCW